MTHKDSSNTDWLDEVLAAVYIAGVSGGLHRDIKDPEEFNHRKEGFLKANPLSREATAILTHKMAEVEMGVLTEILESIPEPHRSANELAPRAYSPPEEKEYARGSQRMHKEVTSIIEHRIAQLRSQTGSLE